MRARLAFLTLLILSAALSRADNTPPADPLAWPPITQELRPWAYNWWMGSAVDEQNLTREMERYHDGGLGGIHIIPIYGAKGAEPRYIDYLSPRWMALLKHAVDEGKRLDMGVDMTTGTGWCFGGPQIAGDDAAMFATVVEAGEAKKAAEPKSGRKPRGVRVLYAVAVAADGRQVELHPADVSPDGTVRNRPSNADEKIYLVLAKNGPAVKRAAPGGEGPMLNTIYGPAMDDFLKPFTAAFSAPGVALPRSMYHDSYEYQGGSPSSYGEWSPDFFQQFQKRRGYDLAAHLPEMAGVGDAETVGRVRCDYHQTVSDLMTGDVFSRWVAWCHVHGILTRNQAHGAPVNLLDFYGIADIPETEVFRDKPDPLVGKVASSAAHVMGHQRTSSETGTWLTEHFQGTLADLKHEIDVLFLGGINHIFYHGCCYSPDDAAWPGWQFYASSEVNPRNAIWHDVPALNEYIARCQSILATGHPDNDALLYWPIHDYFSTARTLGVHLTIEAGDWLTSQPFGETAAHLWRAGVGFDYISDAMLAQTSVEGGKIKTAGGSYRLIVVPPTHYMPIETMRKLMALADGGTTVLFETSLPQDVSGLNKLEANRAEMKQMLLQISERRSPLPELHTIHLDGGGTIFCGSNAQRTLASALSSTRVEPEGMTSLGLEFIRRSCDGGTSYFILNPSDGVVDDKVTLARPAKAVVVMDPMTGQAGLAAIQAQPDGRPTLRLRLESRQAVVLRALQEAPATGREWTFAAPAAIARELDGPWHVHFLEGGPVLPHDYAAARLGSWAHRGDTDAERFAGTARYSIVFDAPPDNGPWLLHLGQVRESARVRLNGQDLGTFISEPFDVPIGTLKPKDNLLEIDVTNLSANRIRDLDRRKVVWRIFNDINYASLKYGKFDASDWPVRDSGLLGPVTLRKQVRVDEHR